MSETKEPRKPVPRHVRDRRVIPRISNADLKTALAQILWMSRIVLGFATIYLLCHLLLHFKGDSMERNRAIFFTGVIVMIAIPLERFGNGVQNFIRNETQMKMTEVMNRLRNLVFIVMFTVLVLGTIQLITSF